MTNLLSPPDVSIPSERRAVMRRRLVEELARAEVPRSGRRRLAVVLAAAGVLAGAGTAVGVSIDFLAEQERVDRQAWAHPDKYLPTNGRVEIARGPDWSVMAWRSAGGICFAVAAGEVTNWGRSCGRMPDRDDNDAYTSDYLGPLLVNFQPAADGRAAMVGAVTEEVASVDVTLADGRRISVSTEPAPPVVDSNARIFLHRARFPIPPRGSWAFRSLVFRDSRGHVLERFTPQRGAGG